ncbi:MAG: hypothetical protein JOZ78_06315 [Chroococcidiopsidaceae cyanobacterium CP_BM_ER_R8_30]|nr:hypothetical protein [Chroococcidiopsidaceae cyanobacterium CP_BM_ER_R8_30]
MKVLAKSLNQLVIGTSVGIVCLFSSVALPVKAEPAAPTPAPVDPLQDFRNPDQSSNPFSSSNQGDNFAVMNLLRNVIRNSNSSGASGFSAGDEDSNLNSAADQFRAKQQQLLHQQAQPPASGSATLSH